MYLYLLNFWIVHIFEYFISSIKKNLLTFGVRLDWANVLRFLVGLMGTVHFFTKLNKTQISR